MFEFSVSTQFHPVSRRLLICSALLLSLFSGNLAAHGVTLKYRDDEAANSAFSAVFLQPWAEKIHDDSRGRINLLIAAPDTEKTDSNLFQTVLERGVDVVWLDLQGPASSHPRFMVFATTLEGSSSTGSSRALWSWTDMNDLGFREFSELRILAVSRHDVPLFHMREGALSSLSDLEGAKIAIPTAEARTFLTELGAIPVVLLQSAMGEALTQQSVDGVLLSWSGLSALGLEKLVTGHTQAPSGAPWPYAQLSLLLMNPDAYRSLTDDLRQVIRANSGGDVSAAIGKTFDEAAMAARNNAAERGDTVNTLPESDLGNWRKAANTASARRAADLDALGLKGEKLIKQARALIAKDDAAK